MINTFAKILTIFSIGIFLFCIHGCEENPTDLGSDFISPDDTLNTQLLASDNDSIAILNSPYTKAFANSISPFMMVGKTPDITAMGLLRFIGLPTGFAGATVNSAQLILKYSNYFYTDSLGNIDFDLYPLVNNYTFSTVTADSIDESSYGTKSVGSFKGVLKDSVTVSVDLQNQLIKDWLEFAANPEHPVQNNGIIFVPNSASNSVKGFVSSNGALVETPYVEISLTIGGNDSTITLNISESSFIARADLKEIPQNRIVLQGGVAIQNFVRFNLGKLPPNVIVNDARLELTLDSANSYFFPVSERRFVASIIRDSLNFQDSLSVISSQILEDKYTMQFAQLVQYWNNGTFENLGLGLSTLSKRLNVDRFVFYASDYADISKRPKFIIRYTIRN